MRAQTSAQIHALDRVLCLLEEGSFRQLERDSENFTDIVENLYEQVSQHLEDLRSH
jgi:type VI protein secretion system component VasF